MLAVSMPLRSLDLSRKHSLSTISSDESDKDHGQGHCFNITRSQSFYFPDGDVILSAGSTRFKVHSNVLALSSPIFQTYISEAALLSDSDSEPPEKRQRRRQSLFVDQRRRSSGASSAASSNRKQLVYFRVPQDAKSVDLLLTFLYPFVHATVDSSNVSTLLRTATAFQITHLITLCIEYLELSLSLHPLLVLCLAERNILNAPAETQDRLKRVYRSASRIVLDDLPNYAQKPSFQRLTKRTRSRLFAKWASYLRQLYTLKTSLSLKYPHACQDQSLKHSHACQDHSLNYPHTCQDHSANSADAIQSTVHALKQCEDHTNALIQAALAQVITTSDDSSPRSGAPPCPSSIVRLFLQGIPALGGSACAPAIRNAMKAVVSRTFGKEAVEEWRYLAIDLEL